MLYIHTIPTENNIHLSTGILAIAKPCSIVVDAKELFGSESKFQVYAHLHDLMQSPVMQTIGTIHFSTNTYLEEISMEKLMNLE